MQHYIEELRREVAKHKGRVGVPIEITNGFAEALLEQIESERAKVAAVTTVEELDALPDQSVILDADGDALQKEDGRWYRTGDNEEWAPEHVSDWFPARLVHRSPNA